ncbi:MAG: PIN domain-containing protein [Candidatus Atabeyarchaeum deiterrae]|jgi:rRNA-processing protein FCF1
MSRKETEHSWPIVLFDSSILISLPECNIDLTTEIERVLTVRFIPTVLSGTLSELRDVLSRSKGEKRKKKLVLALKVAERFKKLDYDSVNNEEMDDVIVRAAKEINAVVATDDGRLRRTLVRTGVPVLFVREKSHLEMEGYLNDSGYSLTDESGPYDYWRNRD